MSMQSTQKPASFQQGRPQSVDAPNRNQNNPQYMSCQKHLRMSIIDQLSPIKDLPVSQQSQRASFYQVRAKGGGINPQLVSTRTQPSRLGESCSFNTTLNYTHESQTDKNKTMPKGTKLSNFEILKDQLRFSICQLDDMKRQFDKNLQCQFEQIIQIIRSASQTSSNLIEENIYLRNQSLATNDYNKLKAIMEELQQKTSVLVGENTRLNQQLHQLQEQNQGLTLKQRQSDESERKLRCQLMNQKENCQLQGNQSKQNGFSQRELSYKLEQTEMKLLTVQISNDNLKKQIQHYQLDYQAIESQKETIGILENKIQELLNQKDCLQQENELMNNKISNMEGQIRDLNQKPNYQSYITNLEQQIESMKVKELNLSSANSSLNNTINQLMEQVKLLSSQSETEELKWKLNSLVQQHQKQGSELKMQQEELLQLRTYYEQCLKKNQNLEMRLLYYMEQEIKANAK